MRPTTYYTGITGIIERIAPIRSECCNQIVSIRTLDGMINFKNNNKTSLNAIFCESLRFLKTI